MRPYLVFSPETAFTSNAARKSDIPSLPILPLRLSLLTVNFFAKVWTWDITTGAFSHSRKLPGGFLKVSSMFLNVFLCFYRETGFPIRKLNCAYSVKICARGSSEENARRAILADFHHIVCFSSTVFWTNCHSVVIFCPRHCESAPGQAAAV